VKRITPEVAKEIGMLLQDQYLDSGPRKEKSEHDAGWPSTRDATMDVDLLSHIRLLSVFTTL